MCVSINGNVCVSEREKEREREPEGKEYMCVCVCIFRCYYLFIKCLTQITNQQHFVAASGMSFYCLREANKKIYTHTHTHACMQQQ